MNIQKLNHVHGQNWIISGYETFKTQAWVLIGFFLVTLVVGWVINLVPVLGFPVGYVISTLLTASWFSVSKKATEKQTLKISDLFEAFNNHCAPLVILCVITLLAYLVALIPVILVMGFTIVKSVILDSNLSLLSISAGAVISGIFSALLFVAVYMATVFAIPLIYFQKMEVTAAMQASFKACNINMWPLTWFSLLWLGLCLLSAVTLGLALLVIMPVSHIAIYYAYRDIFIEQQVIAEMPLAPQN